MPGWGIRITVRGMVNLPPDPATGKIPPRLVDISREKVQNVIKYMLHYITPEDYKAAKEYIPYPADYDFFKILNWDSNEF